MENENKSTAENSQSHPKPTEDIQLDIETVVPSAEQAESKDLQSEFNEDDLSDNEVEKNKAEENSEPENKSHQPKTENKSDENEAKESIETVTPSA